MSTQRQNSLSNISPPTISLLSSAFCPSPNIKKGKKRKEKIIFTPKGNLYLAQILFLAIFSSLLLIFFTKYYVNSLICLQIVSSSLGVFWKLLCRIKLSGRQLLLKNAPFSKLIAMFPCCQCVNNKWNSKSFQLQYILIYKFP